MDGPPGSLRMLPKSPSFDRIWANLGRNQAERSRTLVEFCRHGMAFWRFRARFGPDRSNLLPEIDQTQGCVHRTLPHVARDRPKFGPGRPVSTVTYWRHMIATLGRELACRVFGLGGVFCCELDSVSSRLDAEVRMSSAMAEETTYHNDLALVLRLCQRAVGRVEC